MLFHPCAVGDWTRGCRLMYSPFEADPVGQVSLRLRADPAQIAKAIDTFPSGYHHDFFLVREIARQYLTQPKPEASAALTLAKALRRVLGNWGAGRRAAPALREPRDFEAALQDPKLHAGLTALTRTPLPSLRVVNNHRLIDVQPLAFRVPATFDATLLGVLGALSRRLLVGNTNTTYPMKAVLLITGLMPALDSQVRTGLGRAGFAGIATTRFLLPTDPNSSDGKKLTRLPFLIGECWSAFQPQLQEGIRQSKYPQLAEEPGRVFDVLLFMQAKHDHPINLVGEGDRQGWYDLH